MAVPTTATQATSASTDASSHDQAVESARRVHLRADSIRSLSMDAATTEMVEILPGARIVSQQEAIRVVGSG